MCGTTENVNFFGMCQNCYNASIVIHEKTAEEERKEELEENQDAFKWKRSYNRKYIASCIS